MSEDMYSFEILDAQRHRFVMLSGCSGGGKSTLLAALSRRGYDVFEEPGRQIVKEQMFVGGDALPWRDFDQFVAFCVSRAMHQLALAAQCAGIVFFDRGIVDAVSALERLGRVVPPALATAMRQLRYHDTVFLVPPWREHFAGDAERLRGFDAAVDEYDWLVGAYRRLGYEVVILPKVDIEARADFVIEQLGLADA